MEEIFRGQVVWALLIGTYGEMKGLRPAVVVQNNEKNKSLSTTIIVPLTTRRYENSSTDVFIPAHILGPRFSDSYGTLNNITVIDKSKIREGDTTNYLPTEIMNELDKKLAVLLDTTDFNI